jgi:hypothetical protein
VGLWHWTLRTRCVFSGASEPRSLIPIISCLSVSGTQHTRVTKGFGICPESTRLHNLQSIAQENRCQHLDSPETNPVWYLSVIIQGGKDWLSDIRLMYRILKHGSLIPDLPDEYSHLFPCSRMKFRHTSDPLCWQVWRYQIWHCTHHILFTG